VAREGPDKHKRDNVGHKDPDKHNHSDNLGREGLDNTPSPRNTAHATQHHIWDPRAPHAQSHLGTSSPACPATRQTPRTMAARAPQPAQHHKWAPRAQHATQHRIDHTGASNATQRQSTHQSGLKPRSPHNIVVGGEGAEVSAHTRKTHHFGGHSLFHFLEHNK
jgi:hypothetical protein